MNHVLVCHNEDGDIVCVIETGHPERDAKDINENTDLYAEVHEVTDLETTKSYYLERLDDSH